jgi:putative MFS transporter
MDEATGISSGRAAAVQTAGNTLTTDGLPEIGARLDRLASSKVVWKLMVLLALGGLFDAYMISSGSNIAPALNKAKILTSTTSAFFSLKGYAAFTMATFIGLLVACSGFAVIADRFGRRTIFTVGLLWFSACGVMMAFQTTGIGVIFWRFMLAIGTGIEVITIDAYLSELVPKRTRGRAFAVSNSIHSCGQPLAALAGLSLVPYHLLGVEGWRWLVILGASAAVAVWPLRRLIPESPRWLAAHGRLEEAARTCRSQAPAQDGTLQPDLRKNVSVADADAEPVPFSAGFRPVRLHQLDADVPGQTRREYSRQPDLHFRHGHGGPVRRFAVHVVRGQV